MRFRNICFLLLGTAFAMTTESSSQNFEHFTVTKVNDHLYAYGGWDPTLDLVNGNSYAILTDEGVVVFDAHHLPVIAEENIAHIKSLTDKPVKWLVNSHWHGDHNTGNSAYVDAYPEIQIIAHESTSEILSRRQPEWVGKFVNGEWDDYKNYFGKLLADGKTESGRALTPTEISRFERLMDVLVKYAAHSKNARVALPNTTFKQNMTLHKGGREIQIRYSGKANTPGDAWVWLPQDSILITGDILVWPIPYCFGSFHEDWIKTLDTMLSLNPKIILPGHGEPMYDTHYLRQVRDVLADLVDQAHRGYDKGIRNADSLYQVVRLDSHKKAMCGDDADRNFIFDYFMVKPSLGRLIKVWDNAIGDDRESN